jgi:TRAP-type C4-dicarboxylate transport system substrate-binding protein
LKSCIAGFVASAAAQTTMRISISVAQNSHQGVAIDTFAKEVEKRTGGRYKVRPSTPARWAASANRSKPCSWARRS